MSVEKTVTIVTVEVGRADYSQSVEYSTEPIIRSHLERRTWSSYVTFPTLPYPIAYGILLPFEDREGNVLYYVPEDVEYMIYDVLVGGDYNALTIAGLRKLSWPDLAFIETVAEVYGYGKSSIPLTKGHECEAGTVYLVLATQWSEKASFNISYTVHGMADVVVRG